MRLVLASASPARLRVLRAAGLSPEVVVSGIDEDAVSGTPEQIALSLAGYKAEAVAATLNGSAVVVGCDTVLDLNGEAMGKPSSEADATARWRRLRGQTGNLVTGHCVIRTDTGQQARAMASTAVTFGRPSDAEIAMYISTGEPLLVAGGFTIDGLGGWFVDRLDGDHTNVIGISLPTLRRLLAGMDLPLTLLWRPLSSP